MSYSTTQTPIARRFEENLDEMRRRLGVGVSFDALEREIKVGHRRAVLFFIDGFLKDKVSADVIRALQEVDGVDGVPGAVKRLLDRTISYFETSRVRSIEEAVEQVLAGPMVLFVEGEREAIVLDVREYPARSIEEPDLERVTRGSHEGFVETIVFNTAMIRRRLRDPNLRLEAYKVGRRSRTDVVIGYIADIAQERRVRMVRERIQNAKLDALPMGAKNLEEMVVKQPWNPIPRVRYTERPDVVAAHLLEGHIVILVDTTPMAMIAPVTFFHFLEHAEEFFQTPLVGTYLRWIRFAGFFVATFVPPLWLALYLSPEILPPSLSFIGPKEQSPAVPVALQFILLELGIDLIRMALIHTPSALATSLGIVGAILLGDLAVQVGVFVPETILYMSVSAIGYFAVPSIEFGYAIRLFRYVLLVLTIVWKLPGFLLGCLLGLGVAVRTRSLDAPYLWPVIPFHGPSLVKVLFRLPVPEVGRRPPLFGARGGDTTRLETATARSGRSPAGRAGAGKPRGGQPGPDRSRGDRAGAGPSGADGPRAGLPQAGRSLASGRWHRNGRARRNGRS